MFYSIFVLLFGIYVGQEYDVVPSVRLMTLSLLRYIKENYTNDTNNNPTESNNDTFIYKFLTKFFKQD